MKNLYIVLTAGLMMSVSTVVSGAAPCKPIIEACEKAGFAKGGAKDKTHPGRPQGNGLFHHCLKLIIEGQSVEGVTADAATIEACKVQREKSKSKRAKPSAPVAH